MKIKEIKLCDGFKMTVTNPLEYRETEDLREIREFLSLPVESKEWDIIVREVFCCGCVKFRMIGNTTGRKRDVIIEVIPVKEVKNE